MKSLVKRMDWMLAVLVAAAIVLSACGLAPGAAATETPTVAPTVEPTPMPDPTDTEGEEPAPGGIITGTAQIETLELLLLESFPVQVRAHVTGWLGDGCTEMGEITQVREGNTFYITIPTERPADAVCTQQLVGFEETISLDVVGLKAGTYTVDVNGTTETFTLDVDNVLSEGG